MIDPTVYGGALAEAIQMHARLAQEAADATDAAEQAERDLRGARAEARSAAITAKLKGEPLSEPDGEAERKLKTAKWAADVAGAAATAAQDRLVEEAQKPEYDAKLAKAEEAAVQTSLNLLGGLDKALGAVSDIRAKRYWLTQPTRADKLIEPNVWPVQVVGEWKRPNGMPADAKALLAGVRSGLRRDAEQPAHESYGLPLGKGEVLWGPWGPAERMDKATLTSSAAALFEEQANGRSEE